MERTRNGTSATIFIDTKALPHRLCSKLGVTVLTVRTVLWYFLIFVPLKEPCSKVCTVNCACVCVCVRVLACVCVPSRTSRLNVMKVSYYRHTHTPTWSYTTWRITYAGVKKTALGCLHGLSPPSRSSRSSRSVRSFWPSRPSCHFHLVSCSTTSNVSLTVRYSALLFLCSQTICFFVTPRRVHFWFWNLRTTWKLISTKKK